MKLLKGLLIGCLALSLVACSNNKEKQRITLEEAKAVALKHAKLTEDKVQFGEAGGDSINGMYQYEIEFKDNNGKAYDYLIHGDTGEIIKYDHDYADQDKPTTSQNNLTMKQAKDIALKHASLNEADVTFTETKEDNDDGVKVYDIEFNNKNNTYEYEINIQNGEIRSYHHKRRNNTNASKKAVTLDEAKSIALKDAKISNTDINFITAKEETEDGIRVYDLKFQNSNKTYEYEIEKATGLIISFEVK